MDFVFLGYFLVITFLLLMLFIGILPSSEIQVEEFKSIEKTISELYSEMKIPKVPEKNGRKSLISEQ